MNGSKKMKCEICGSTDDTVDYYVGGPFSMLCKQCAEITEKVLERYINILSNQTLAEISQIITKYKTRDE